MKAIAENCAVSPPGTYRGPWISSRMGLTGVPGVDGVEVGRVGLLSQAITAPANAIAAASDEI